jgi:release factor glutamine methyltransferase
LTYPEAPVPDETGGRFVALVRRRCAGEPLEYITGEQEFFGLSFLVNPAVLIPRPETEILVEKALALAHNSSVKSPRFADVGTGSGCIAISVARECPQSQMWAVDVSPAALAVARRNAVRHGVADRVHFACADMLECFRPRPDFDFILSNPPYVAGTEIPDLPPVVRDHEPRLALFGGESGLDACVRLAAQARRHLAPGGFLLMEIGAGQSEIVARILRGAGLAVEPPIADLRGIPRCIIGVGPRQS